MSFNSFYSNPRNIKSVEYLKLLFISLDSPLVALVRDIFKLTKGCLTSQKIEHDERAKTRPASKYDGQDVTSEGASCRH